ncbi:MAG: hypothetical protein AAFQ82_25230, partial [Myxococcota bacterium]
KKRKKVKILRVTTVEYDLQSGSNVFTFKPSKAAKAGFFFRLRPVEAPPLEPPVEDENEPPLVASEFEPDLVAEVDANSVRAQEPGFDIVAPSPPSKTVTSPDGDGFFLQLAAADGLGLAARGTGVLVFDFHAHRNPSNPSTLEPAVLAVLLDDVLVDTLKVEAPASPQYSVADADFQLSDRAQFQVTIPPGNHRVMVTLSDTALDGGSIRVRFETAGVESVETNEPFVPPEPPPLVEIRDTPAREVEPNPTWVGLGFSGGTALGNSSGQLGFGGLAEFFVLPADFGRVAGVGLTSGFRTVQTSETVGDLRSATGSSEVSFTENAVPVLLDLRLNLDLGDVAFHVGAGGGGVVSWTRTEALGSAASTGTDFIWALGGHVTVLARAGDGWLTLKSQLSVTDPQTLSNLRDFDAGALMVTLGYVFSSY